eukprot:2840331-Pyramimonas_sp.AAC.1
MLFARGLLRASSNCHGGWDDPLGGGIHFTLAGCSESDLWFYCAECFESGQVQTSMRIYVLDWIGMVLCRTPVLFPVSSHVPSNG